MKKIFLILLCLIATTVVAAPPGHYGPYDPGAARANLSNVDATATPSMTSITLSDKVKAAWADILGDIYASGTVKVSTGTAAAPAYSFASDPNTGVYSPAADNLAVSVGGVQVVTFAATGLGLTSPLTIPNGGTGKTTAAEALAALGGASLNGSSTVDFSARNTRGYGWNRLASGTFTTADYFTLTSGTSKTIDFTLASNVGVACEVSATMQFSSTKQAFGVWHSTFYFTAASGIAGLVHQQTVDLDDSQLLTVAWSWAATNTLRVTFTNTHTGTLFEITPSIKIISRRAGDMSQ